MLLLLLVLTTLFLLWLALAPRAGQRALRTREALATPYENLRGLLAPPYKKLQGALATPYKNLRGALATPYENLRGLLATPYRNLRGLVATPYQNLRGSLTARLPLPRRRVASRQEQFKRSVNVAAANPEGGLTADNVTALKEFATWLDGLSDQERQAFVDQVAATCHRLNLDLDWLLDGRARGDMQQVLQDTVLLHSLAVWRAQALKPFARLEAYRAAPHARAHREFAQQVFARLAKQQVITISPEMMLAPAAEWRKFVPAAIEQAATENLEAVIVVVKQVMAEEAKRKKRQARAERKSAPAVEPQIIPPGTAEVAA